MIIACMGLQWGDEGKGKIADILSEQADYVVKYHGGPNSGSHIRLNGKDFKLHHIPAGVLRGKNIILANGMVIDPIILEREVKELEEAGFPIRDRIFISHQAHVIQEKHREADSTDVRLGTTRRGIGFCYADKMLRTGIRIGELKDFFLKDRVVDTVMFLNELADQNKKIFLQGSQGALLDIDHGTYPFVTSSSVGVGGIFSGTGLSPKKVDKIIGVAKCYQTRIGTGPFPTEDKEAVSLFREKGKEYGVTTGRPRRCGWLDVVALKYACEINGIDMLAITKMDILEDIPEIKICVGYKRRTVLGENEVVPSPSFTDKLEDMDLLYSTKEGWTKETFSDKGLDYAMDISELVHVPLAILSKGPEREDVINFVNIEDIWRD